jgi:uncharacterized membrane protein YozB (DUF420 family)
MFLPTLNAILNTIAASLLVTGFIFVRRGNIVAHRRCMLAALGVSALFLMSYLLHHYRVGSVPFRGTGVLRTIYFTILIPHVVLAALVVPMALVTVVRGLTNKIERHRSLARVTLPIWLFVSVSGVVVYLMLYQM